MAYRGPFRLLLAGLVVLLVACGGDSGETSAGASSTAKRGTGGASAPVAQDQSVSTAEDAPLTGQLVATVKGNRQLTYLKVSDPRHGAVVVNANGGFTYTPATEYYGADSFTFKANDGHFDSNVATVSITVTLVNEPPVAQDQTVTAAANVPLKGRLVATDEASENETLTFSKVADPLAGGVVVNADGTFLYTPKADFEGPDRFTFKANDGQLDSNVATVTIHVQKLLVVGVAKRSIQPNSQHIQGLIEERAFGGGTHLQKFNLGGFGVNLSQNMPDPVGQNTVDRATTTEPAGRRVFTDSAGVEENMNLRLFLVQQPGASCANPASAAPGSISSCNDIVVFVMIDAIGAGNIIQAGVKNAIVAAAAAQGVTVHPDNILFGLTHSHTANDLQGLWGGVPQDWVNNVLYKAAGDAAAEAVAGRRPARLNFRQGYTTAYNNYRRPRIDPNAHADGTITLLEAVSPDGPEIGSILQYNAHPTTVGNGNEPRTPHSEYILGAMDWLEGHEGGTALYYNGPIADASPAGSRPGCVNAEANNPDPSAYVFGVVRCRGEGIADYLLHPGNVVTARELAPTLEARSTQVVLPITNPLFLAAAGAGSFNRYYNFAEVPTGQIPGLTAEQKADLPQVGPVTITTVSRITLGGEGTGLEIVSIPGETTNTYANYIRGLAKTNVMLLGLTHNSFGYILPEEEFNYVDQTGKAGFVLPFTGYEEYVSLGPLTATLLRSEAYVPLFSAAQTRNAPPAVTACLDGTSTECELTIAEERVNVLINSVERCAQDGWRADGCFNGFFRNFDPITQPIASRCRSMGGPAALCDALGGVGAGSQPIPVTDARLIAASADAQLRGCDMLDTSECLFPFPNDWFTVPAAHGSPQGVDNGGTGLRINFNVLAMPRNAAGKPIDPTEWNRNDGYSPGQLIVTYVPGIGTVKGRNPVTGDLVPVGPIAGAVPITNLSLYLHPDAPIMVLDTGTATSPLSQPVRHPIYAEIDLNAGYLLPMQGFGPRDDKKPALLIRPAKNFLEGHRYVVVLRNLKTDYGAPIFAGPAFTQCRDNDANPGAFAAMPVLQARCKELHDSVFPVVRNTGIKVQNNGDLYLAWDFTVASAHNNVGRLVAMRDDAFRNYLHDDILSAPGQVGYPGGDAPKFAITKVTENPDGASGKTVRRVQGTLTVPSYVVPADPAPTQADKRQLQNIADMCQQLIQGNCGIPGVGSVGDGIGIAGGLSLPPNRLNYEPDSTSANVCDPNVADPGCALQARYGNGLPKRDPAGDLTTTFTCNIPRSAVSGAATMDATQANHATAAQVKPVRPTLYGHGLLGSQDEGNGQASDFGNVYGFMTCATDWFGFATGDIGNVASSLVDLSNFAVVPDGAQQGVLNMLFLARLAVHPNGFAADPHFQVGGVPVFDRREVFYNGNSQGGIMGGVVIAASKDINRGMLGVLGMNYSTLLARSTDFAPYSIPLYLSYQDDLDRPFVMSLMQMLWDRAENDGYAEHITDNSAMGGPDNAILMQPVIGDHQVTMWSAEVMARTVGAKLDRHRVRSSRDPDTAQYYGLTPVDFAGGEQWTGSALVPYDQMPDPAAPNDPTKEHWHSQNDGRCDHNRTDPPPIGNVPPNRSNRIDVQGAGGTPPAGSDPSIESNAGADPHECPRRDPQARCQTSHFLLATPRAGSADTGPVLVDVSGIDIFGADSNTAAGCPAVLITGAPTTAGSTQSPGYGGGLFGAIAQFGHDLNKAIASLTKGDIDGAAASAESASANFISNVKNLPRDPTNPGASVGQDPQDLVRQTTTANRGVEPVVISGAQIPQWSQPAATGFPQDNFSGFQAANASNPGHGPRNAHAGVMLYPPNWQPGDASVNNGGAPVEEIAAYAYCSQTASGPCKGRAMGWNEIPVQVDEKYPFFLANGNSTFSFYSGIDQEVTYAWDIESWGMTRGECAKAYDPTGIDVPGHRPGFYTPVIPASDPNQGVSQPIPDPVAGLDDDDEIVFMASDAGEQAPSQATPPGATSVLLVTLNDPLQPNAQTYVYLVRKPDGSSYRNSKRTYVAYQRDANADLWIDRYFFKDGDPLKLGTSNTSYGPNLTGQVCLASLDDYHGHASACLYDANAQQYVCPSIDRFPRDGVTVSTPSYQWYASGRWMVRDMRVATPDGSGYGPDLIDRWKGRAFQQSPDSNISLVGFEDEQVNWEANSSLIGERCGPVRCMREVWGADSGTNVTKTETFYRDVITYRFHVRVHPIPPDGLYTSWDYNRGVMVPTAAEQAAGVEGGRYFTSLRPQGVPIDGVNDDVGQIDSTPSIGGKCVSKSGPVQPNPDGTCPTFFDAADPTFNVPVAFDNWEQVSAKGNLGSLVYTFEIKGPTSLANPLVVPYYRDDACFDDGTGDDPVQRPWPKERSTDPRVQVGYLVAAQARGENVTSYDQLTCADKQGAYGAHGIHYFVTGDSDNLFSPFTTTEIDGQQWQFAVPTDRPKNVGEPYANTVRVPLQVVVTPH